MADDRVHDVHVVLGTQTVGGLAPCAAARRDRNARPQLQQVHEIPAVQGQILDRSRLQRAAQNRVGRIDLLRLGCHRDRLRLLAGLHRDVHPLVPVRRPATSFAFDRPKALVFDPDLVRTRGQIGGIVRARRIRRQSSRPCPGPHP